MKHLKTVGAANFTLLACCLPVSAQFGGNPGPPLAGENEMVLLAQATPADQPAVVATGDAPTDTPEIKELRDGLIDAFNKRDVDRLLSYLHPNVVVTWQNAEVSHGREEVRAYYNKMLVGPDAIVKEMGSDPKVEGRKVFGDTSISYGKLNDWFKLKDGLEVHLDSRFSTRT